MQLAPKLVEFHFLILQLVQRIVVREGAVASVNLRLIGS